PIPATLFSAPAAVVATSELVLHLTLEGLFDKLSNPEPHKLRPKVAPAVLHSVRQQHFNPLAGPLRCRYSLAHGDASLLRFGANRSRFRFSHRRGCIPSLFPANLGHHLDTRPSALGVDPSVPRAQTGRHQRSTTPRNN